MYNVNRKRQCFNSYLTTPSNRRSCLNVWNYINYIYNNKYKSI